MLIFSGCNKRETALKKFFDDYIVKHSADDVTEYIGAFKEERWTHKYALKYDKWHDMMSHPFILSDSLEISQYDALEIGDAVIKLNFDEKQIEPLKNYDVYELDGKDIFIVKRYDDQKNIYVALDKTNCEILGVWEE